MVAVEPISLLLAPHGRKDGEIISKAKPFGKNSDTPSSSGRFIEPMMGYPEVNLFAASKQAARILTVWYILGKIDA
jgi:hypothetical protein